MKHTFVIITKKKGLRSPIEKKDNLVEIYGPFFKEEIDRFLPEVQGNNPELITLVLNEDYFKQEFFIEYNQSFMTRVVFYVSSRLAKINDLPILLPTMNENIAFNDYIYLRYNPGNYTLSIGFSVLMKATMAAEIILDLNEYLPRGVFISILKSYYLDKKQKVQEGEFIAQKELVDFPIYSN